MKLLSSIFITAGLASAASHPGTLSFPFSKGSGASLFKRQAGSLNTAITQYQQSLYFVNFTLGTPPQPLAVQLDTGSADFIVVGTGSPLCNDGVSCVTGTYNQKSSSTAKNTALTLNNTYGDGTNVLGNYVTDTLGLDGDSIPNVDVAVAMTGNTQNISFIGLMGVGYPTLEGTSTEYPNIMVSLNASGQIASDTFSLWLDDLEANTGTILFGGVDLSKFNGNLTILNIQQIQGQYVYYNVPLASMTLSGSSSGVNLGGAQSVLLDSGSSLMSLPQSVLDSLMSPLSLTYDSVNQLYLIPCSASKSSNSLSFQFGSSSGSSVSVPMSELVLPNPGSNSCLFGIQPGSPGSYILGDTFLRSAYVLFNLQDNVIGIAQTNTNPGSSNIVALNSTSSGTISIPSGTAVSGQLNPTGPTSVSGGGIGPTNPAASGTAFKSSAAGAVDVGKSVYLGAWAMTGLLVLGGVLGGGMIAL